MDSTVDDLPQGAGLGAIFWEPMLQGHPDKPSQEWIAFTNNLWKLQLLQNRDVLLTDEIRAVWYELSQGVMDIVVKLFVLSVIPHLILLFSVLDGDRPF